VEDSAVAIQLAESLDDHRNTGALLVIDRLQTLAELRHLFLNGTEHPSMTLRGLSYVSVEEMMNRYFETKGRRNSGHEDSPGFSIWRMNPDERGTEEGVRSLWEIWSTVYRLIPEAACRGGPL
jgi:hypothetical protein